MHGSTDVWRGPAPFAVRLDEVSLPDGAGGPFGRLVLEHPGAAVVLAVDTEERALVLWQYRHPAATRFVELPAGVLDVPGEDPLVAAQRELREEALLVAERWELLLTTYPSPGLSSERIVIFLARDLAPVTDRGGFVPEHEEAVMTTHWVPVAELVDGVLSGRFRDGPLALAVLTYATLGRGGASAD